MKLNKTINMLRLALLVLLLITLGTQPTRAFTHSDQLTELPGLSTKPLNQYTGFVGQKHAKLFYWLVADHSSEKPLILWSNGGPAYTSLFGFFYEIGPYEITPKLMLKPRQNSWNKFANLLYIDHPAGVGLSNLPGNIPPKNLTAAIDHYYQALIAFLKQYPEYQHSPLYLAGESYAGTSLPLLAEKIKSNKSSKVKVNLKGLILISLWADPKLQQSMDSEYAYSHGLISRAQKDTVDKLYTKCNTLLTDKQYIKANAECEKVSNYIAKQSGLSLTNINFQNRNYDGPYLESYLNQTSVKKALHAEDTGQFISYSNKIGNAFNADVQKSVFPELNQLLSSDLHIMIISGLSDGKDSNYMGVGKMIEQFNWPQKSIYQQAVQTPYKINGKVIGNIQSGGNLTWLKVFNAGHIVPQDQPLISYPVEEFVKDLK